MIKLYGPLGYLDLSGLNHPIFSRQTAPIVPDGHNSLPRSNDAEEPVMVAAQVISLDNIGNEDLGLSRGARPNLEK